MGTERNYWKHLAASHTSSDKRPECSKCCWEHPETCRVCQQDARVTVMVVNQKGEVKQ